MTEQEILDKILIADGFLIELQTAKLLKQSRGCDGCEQTSLIAQIIVLKEQLLYQISIEDYGEDTERLYDCLLGAIDTYSGSSITIDPNSSVPGVIIVVPRPDMPQWIDIPWNEFESADEDANGARYTFRADWLKGWNPAGFIQGGTQLVLEGSLPTDDATPNYNMYQDANDGVFRLKAGFGIYDGSYVRFASYQTYIAPPLPAVVVGVALIDNQSNISIQYNDNGAGLVTLPSGQQFIKSPIVNGQFLNIQYSGTNFEMTVYNSDGTIFNHLGPFGGTGINISAMDITKRYEIILTTP